MTTHHYRYSDVVVEHKAPVEKLYIIKEGSVRLQQLKPVFKNEHQESRERLFDNLYLDPRIRDYRVSKNIIETKYKDLAQRDTGQSFCEEYFLRENRQSEVRVIVSSATATIVTISFELMSSTLTTYEKFRNQVKQAIEFTHSLHASNIQTHGSKRSTSPLVKRTEAHPSQSAERLKRSIIKNDETFNANKILKVPKLIQ